MLSETEIEVVKKAIKFKADWYESQVRGNLSYLNFEENLSADYANDAAYLDTVLNPIKNGDLNNSHVMFECVLFYIVSLNFILKNISLENEIKIQHKEELDKYQKILEKLASYANMKRDTKYVD